MTSLLRVKVRRDLRAAWSRIALMVVAIVVSLTVFSAVLYAWSATARETSSAYLGTNPASATILLDRGIDAEQMAAITAKARTRPGIIEASGRTQFTTEIDVNGRLRETRLQVFAAAPDDPMRLATFEVQQGSWPPSAGDIFIGRDTLALLDVVVGDLVIIKTLSGEPVRLRVAAVVYDPSLAPAPQEQTGHGYLSSATLGANVLFDQLKIQVADQQQPMTPSHDRDAIVAVATDVGTWLQQDYGLTIREIQVPKPYAHPHQGQTDALLLSLLFGGGIALLLSTILVANMLNGLFTQQIPQIGILKAIGAQSGHIGRLYLAMTLIVAGTATLVALPLGMVIGRAGASAVLGFLGIEATSLAAPAWTHLVVLTAGLLLPPMMALFPLVKTSRTTVRAAIDHHGRSSTAGTTTAALARMGRLRGLDHGLLMALRNAIRRPARFLLCVGLLASAGMVFVAGMSTSYGVGAIQQEAQDQRQWDVDVQLGSPASMDDLAMLLEQVPDVSRVEGLNIVRTGISGPQQIPVSRTYPDQGHGKVSVTAVSTGSTMFTAPRLLEGRWLNPGETGTIVVNQIAREIARANTAPNIIAGDTVELSVSGHSTTWRVVGIVEERVGGGGAYVTAEGFAEATGQPRQVNQLRIATLSHDEQVRTAVAATVDEILTAAGVDVQSVASVSRADLITEGHLRPIILIVLAISIAMGVIGCIGLASTMSANILERTREFGIMHAIGAQPRAIRRIVVAEGVFLALISCLAAVVPTLGLIRVMGAGLGNLFMYAPLPFRISILAAGIWTVLVTLGAIVATEAAATRASRLTIREALDYI